jgi:CDP-glucose 4,6-dehydratase
VIGGGDWGQDRLIPDVMRAALSGEPISIRNPEAVRPWQHVLSPLSGYVELAQALVASPERQGGWNFGPAAQDVRPVRWIAERIGERWDGELRWELDAGPHPHEARHLALDSTKARTQLGWSPAWDLGQTLDSIVDWYAGLRAEADMRALTIGQIDSFIGARR